MQMKSKGVYLPYERIEIEASKLLGLISLQAIAYEKQIGLEGSRMGVSEGGVTLLNRPKPSGHIAQEEAVNFLSRAGTRLLLLQRMFPLVACQSLFERRRNAGLSYRKTETRYQSFYLLPVMG